MKKYEWVDHPADVGFKAFGEDIEEAFENAALALTDIRADVEKIRSREEISVEIEAEDLEALLFDWLDYFLYLADAKDFVPGEIRVSEISEKNDEWSLKAKIKGEEYDLKTHGQKTEVKAITYHEMEINQTPGDCYVQVIVDI